MILGAKEGSKPWDDQGFSFLSFPFGRVFS